MSDAKSPQAQPGVLAIDPYVPGKSGAGGSGKIHKLSSNESPLGPSPAARRAYLDAAANLALYPDGAASRLREAIANRYGLDAERIVCGNGSDDLLHLIAQAFIGPGDEGIFTRHAFLVYRIAILASGGKPVVVDEADFVADVDAIVAAVTPKTKVVFLANPNNPTGTYLPFESVKRLQEQLPSSVLLVLDAAYAEYVRRNDYSSGMEIAATTANVLMVRTFSKIHGLAALRLGWAYGPRPIIDAVNRIRGPFNVNSAALEAGRAAIADEGHVEASVAHNEQWLGWLARNIAELGIRVTPSVGNFLLLHFPGNRSKNATAADAYLTSRGLILRGMTAYGMPDALRLSVGTEDANRAAVAALAAFMREPANA